MCIEAWVAAAEAMPEAAASALSATRAEEVREVALATSGRRPSVAQKRLVVPLTPPLCRWRTSTWRRGFAPFLTAMCIVLEVAMFAGVPGTQPMDIVHSCAPVAERGLDWRGAGAVAQMDIRAFYDSVLALRCCRCFQARGSPATLCAAVVRHQLCRQSKSRPAAAKPMYGGADSVRSLRVVQRVGPDPGAGCLRRTTCCGAAEGFHVGVADSPGSQVLREAAYIDNVCAVGPTP